MDTLRNQSDSSKASTQKREKDICNSARDLQSTGMMSTVPIVSATDQLVSAPRATNAHRINERSITAEMDSLVTLKTSKSKFDPNSR